MHHFVLNSHLLFFFFLINLKLALSFVLYLCSILNLQQYLTVSDFLISENLVYNVAKSLPQEIDKTHQQRWDAVIASQYLRDLREAKKQGRKEKKHKEAQAVLAAATAAAASSTRVSSFRKDTIDESMQQEVICTCFFCNSF